MVDEAVQDYIDRIPAEYRAMFDRVHRLVLEVQPNVAVVLSYKMPSYKIGGRSLHIGVWKHGLSIYGWKPGRDDAFTERHPGLKTSTGTLRLRRRDAARLTDDEIRDLLRAALDP